MTSPRFLILAVVVVFVVGAAWLALQAGRDAEPLPAVTTSLAAATTTVLPVVTVPSTTTTQKPVPKPKLPAVAVGDLWARLASCETGGKMDNPNTGNGYYGYFQFALGTWRGVGGTGYPHEHSYEHQLALAKVLQARSGWGQWPTCGRLIGVL